ncbi:hypothetical protein [Kitasatospora sp. NPDC089509]|uniref:hypothetical protein n=1 Tax=Kitasatospora sp. NPDC089509 TaxID=3364079 RepID=UPI00380D27CB
MDTEDMVRGALRDEASGLAVGQWSAEPVRLLARRRQRRRRTVLGAAAVTAAFAVAAGTGTVLSAQHGDRGTAPAARAPQLPAGPAPEPVVVQPGQQLPLGRPDWWIRLADREICIHDAPSYHGGPGCSGYSWLPGGGTEITMQYYGDPAQSSEGLYNLVYRGPGPVARMTLEVDGRAYWATVTSLPGTPGYTSGHAWAPATPNDHPLQGVRLAAYDTQGKLLASKTL